MLLYILQVSTNAIVCYYSVGHICEDPLPHSPLYCSLWVILSITFSSVGLLTLVCFFVELVLLQSLAANSRRTPIDYFYMFMYKESKSNHSLSVQHYKRSPIIWISVLLNHYFSKQRMSGMLSVPLSLVNIIISRYDLTVAMLVFYIERYVILTAEICMYDTVI